MGIPQFKRVTLRGSQRFDQLFTSGKKIHSACGFLIVSRQREATQTRIAICVGRKTGKAVKRNKLKRVTKESIEPIVGHLVLGFDVAFFPKQSLLQLSHEKRCNEVKNMFEVASLLSRQV